MRVDLTITGGRLVTPTGILDGGLAIENGRIVSIAKEVNLPSSDETIKLNGEFVTPGAIDPHVHFRSPWMEIEGIDTGTASAAGGGITLVIDFLYSGEKQSLLDAFHSRKSDAEAKSRIDYSLHAIVSDGTADELNEIETLVKLGIVSFKIFTTYSDFVVVNNGYFLDVFREVARTGGMVSAHCEDDGILSVLTERAKSGGQNNPTDFVASRPKIAEAVALQTMLELARVTRARFRVVHLSTEQGVQLMKSAKLEGLTVFSETCPQYLVFTSKDMESNGFLKKTCPPLRDQRDVDALWRGLALGIVDMVGTDHSPMHLAEDLKRNEHDIWAIEPGMPGLETMVPLLLDRGVNRGRLSMEQFASVTSTRTAKVLNLYPRKGVIQLGADADLTIIDLKKEAVIRADELHSVADYTPFEGMRVTGVPVMTIVRGTTVMENGYPGDIVGPAGYGEFVPSRAMLPSGDPQ